MHEDLIAPFDFPIYKTEAELFEERNLLLKNFAPIYRIDSTQVNIVSAQFKVNFSNEWNSFFQKNQQTNNLNVNQGDLIRKKNQIERESLELFRFVYSKGIVNRTESFIPGETARIKILLKNTAVERGVDEVFTTKSAIEYITKRVNKPLEFESKDVAKFLEDFDYTVYVQPNLFFDEKITDKLKNQMLNAISITKGMVQSGTKIINHDELVDSNKYLILESLKREYENKLGQRNFFSVLFGQILIVSFLFFILYIFLLNNRNEILADDSKILFILILITAIVVGSSFILRSNIISIYVVPFAIIPIFMKAFYDGRVALFAHLVTIFLVGFFAPNGYEFIFINFIAGVVSIISLSNLFKRGKLFISISLILITYWIVYIGLVIVQEGTLRAINWFTIAWFTGNALLLMASYQLVYFFEKMFGFLSDATLMELSDTNQELLRKLAEVAPGTFQHSLQVANLSEAAVYKIGGNPLLVRAGALYHDIGKIANPLFYIENQPPDYNPHQNLEYEESASIIIKHVTEGVQIAKKYKLPEQLIDFIRTHHGTNKVQYFYRLYKGKSDTDLLEDSKFTYTGPRPFSKETVVVMMADSIEAASRSIRNINFKIIDELVDEVVKTQLADEQFNEANITFKDITTIKAIFKKKLMNIYHARIEYPKHK